MSAEALLVLLGRFVRPGDTNLSRDQFLRVIIDRIVDDLSSLTTKRKEP